MLASVGYFIRVNTGWGGTVAVIDYNTYVWIARLFIVGPVAGYLHDKIRLLKDEAADEQEYMSGQLADIRSINESNVRVKDALSTQIINQNGSIGKIHSVTSGLDQLMPEEVLFRAASMLDFFIIVSVIIYLVVVIFLPRLGYGGLVMEFYHCLAAGYFPLFIMYAAVLLLYYFNDLSGALIVSALFCLTVFIGSLISTHLPYFWGGLGGAGSLVSFIAAYFRLRGTERNFDTHVFCNGRILKPALGVRPSGKVFDRYNGIDETELVAPK